MYDLSILIPARNEEFLALTVENLLKNKRGSTEIIVGLDGEWANPPLEDHPDLTVVYYPTSLGQRAMTNQLCRLSTAKYVMKIDAHVAVDEGFDVKMISRMKDDYTMVPIMYNLHAFNWVCTQCNWLKYQGPTPPKCPECGSAVKKDILWKQKPSPQSTSYTFDTTLHFQYFGQYKKQQKKQQERTGSPLVDTMSLQGSCFMLTREKYWELNISDEAFGSWGQQGVEVACKTWLSGGRVVCNMDTWYAHMFRTQGGDFSFPYKLSGKQIDHARKFSRKLFIDNTWDKQIYPLSWLIEKFKPVPYWHDEKGREMLEKINEKGREFYKSGKAPVYAVDMKSIMERLEEGAKGGSNDEIVDVEVKPSSDGLTKQILYYTDNRLNLKISHAVQGLLTQTDIPITSVSLKPMPHFGNNIYLGLERGYVAQTKQILEGLIACTADVIYFCEHDVLYHPSHFDFIPRKKDVYYYNVNVWRVRQEDGHALWTDNLKQLSGLVAYRDTLLLHYKQRYLAILNKLIELNNDQNNSEFNKYIRAMGFEPGTHGRPERIDDLKSEGFMSIYPNIDIRHQNNLTPSRWKKEQFRNERYTEGWKETNIMRIQGWDFKNGLLHGKPL